MPDLPSLGEVEPGGLVRTGGNDPVGPCGLALWLLALGCGDSGEQASASAGTSTSTSASTGTTTGVGDSRFSITSSLSPEIATVGIVDWSVSVPIDSAHVDFGRDPNAFEYRAPVLDAARSTHRTLLLGMKEARSYSARIVAQSSSGELVSPVFTLETGFLPNALPQITVNDPGDVSRLFGGFTVTCNGFQNATNAGVGGPGGGQTYAFILDADGDLVWAYETTGTVAESCSAARFAYSGQYLWLGNFSNVDDDGALMRVTLDGLDSQVYDLPARHHHFTVLPDDTILFQEQANGGTIVGGEGEDLIKRLDPETGEVTLLYDQNTHFAQQIEERGAHTNYLSYVPHLNAISFSMRHTDTIALLSYPNMDLMAVFGGPQQVNTFGLEWTAQHGHQFYDDRLLIFNNNNGGSRSYVIEFSYDLSAGTASETFRYDGGYSSPAFGEVQKLGNGNILVNYSVASVFHEITADGQLLREMVSSDPLGYARRRLSLYGPPPPFAD